MGEIERVYCALDSTGIYPRKEFVTAEEAAMYAAKLAKQGRHAHVFWVDRKKGDASHS